LAAPLPRRVVGAVSSLLVATAAVAGLAGPAQAEDGFQYWNYFHLENQTWAFSEVGPADHQPADGDVEGFRYGTSTVSQGIEPRADLQQVNFDTVCADTEAAEGEKRVAVLVDYGVDEGNGAPPEARAECAVVAEDASTQRVLDQVADVRVEGGMTCALDGYPATGCGVPVKDADIPAEEETVAFALPSDGDDAGTSDAAAESESSETPWGLVGLGALVVLIAGGAFAMNRRSKTA
jgi:hypothetical protein